MTRHPSHRTPIINSSGTRRLAAQIGALRRRNSTLDDTIAAIRSGNDRVLHELVVRAQGGNSDAVVTAIWALHPRLAAVVINRLPAPQWRQGIDDFMTFAYLTIVDVDSTQPAVLLSDKIISRTRRRYERAVATGPDELQEPALLARLPGTADVERSVLAGISLDEVVAAVNTGLLSADAWRTLLRLRFGGEIGTATPRERKAASRAQLRLVEWSKAA